METHTIVNTSIGILGAILAAPEVYRTNRFTYLRQSIEGYLELNEIIGTKRALLFIGVALLVLINFFFSIPIFLTFTVMCFDIIPEVSGLWKIVPTLGFLILGSITIVTLLGNLILLVFIVGYTFLVVIDEKTDTRLLTILGLIFTVSAIILEAVQ